MSMEANRNLSGTHSIFFCLLTRQAVVYSMDEKHNTSGVLKSFLELADDRNFSNRNVVVNNVIFLCGQSDSICNYAIIQQIFIEPSCVNLEASDCT